MIAMRLILKPKLKNCSDPPHARYRKGRFWRSLGDLVHKEEPFEIAIQDARSKTGAHIGLWTFLKIKKNILGPTFLLLLLTYAKVQSFCFL